ncbi:hypothetical protein [Paraburkholderia sp. GAS41]|uniref:hypothetical protein n=1 Tax=Paraburkholderia sp. GAS41 TaxID=3035134 RepID=UPI003D1C575F
MPDIADAPGQSVWGVLLWLSDDAMARLGETWGKSRVRAERSVIVQSARLPNPEESCVPALASGVNADVVCFLAKDQGAPLARPDETALRDLLTAALQFQFPLSYVRSIASVGQQGILSVDDIRVGAIDISEKKIDEVYYKSPSSFAVYRAGTRVLIQYADDAAIAGTQRANVAELNLVRSRISATLDSWSRAMWERKKRLTTNYQNDVAAALNQCLEGDADNALKSLNEILGDMAKERSSMARFNYLWLTLLVTVIYVLVLLLLKVLFTRLPPTLDIAGSPLLLAAGAGSIGAFFSIAIGMRQRTVLTDLSLLDILGDISLRVTIGVISAGILLLCLRTGLVPAIKLDVVSSGVGSPSLDAVMLLGIVAGFFERLVPDLLSKTVKAAVA